MRRAAWIVLLAALAAQPAIAAPAAAQPDPPAVLKLQVQLDAGVIKVGDLWANAGAKAGTVVGPAPPPGHSIAVEAAQLAYIARLYDVAWRPVSGAERTSVERAGRPLTRDEMAEPIRRSLIEAGAGASATVEFANFAPILVPPMAFPLLSVEGIAYDAASERFSANLAASSDGMQTQHMRVSGRVQQTVKAVVATRRLQPGDVIAAADVRLTQVAERRLAGPVLSELEQAVGQSPKRAVVAGQPLAAGDIGPPVLVAKGATVVLVLDAPGLSLAAQGLALGPGGRDDVIQVMNPLSRAVVAARVTGPGRAVVAAGSAPLVAPAATSKAPEVAN